MKIGISERLRASRAARKLPMLAGATASVLIAVQSVLADDWETYQHDTAHTGYSTSSYAPSSLKLSWSAPLGFSTPQIVGGNVIATENGQGGG